MKSLSEYMKQRKNSLKEHMKGNKLKLQNLKILLREIKLMLLHRTWLNQGRRSWIKWIE